MSATQIKLKNLPSALTLMYLAKRNGWLWGRPSIGKTDTIHAWVAEMQKRVDGFELHEFYGATLGPSDIQMTMPDMKERVLAFLNNNRLPNWYVVPNAVGVLFIGEAGLTDPTVFKIMQKYVNGEDMNGVLRKPPGIFVVCDSNRIQDKSGVATQSRALMRRFLQLDAYTDAQDNIDYAEAHNWHPAVQTFFKECPAEIDNYEAVFDPPSSQSKKDAAVIAEEGKRGLWAHMGGWKGVSDLEAAAESAGIQVMPQLICGSVGTGVGAKYMAHRAMFGRLASVEEIVKDPKKVKVPTKLDELYAQVVLLTMRCELKHLPKVKVYVDRGVPHDLQAMMLRRLLERSKREAAFDVSATDTYREWVQDPQLRHLVMAR